MKGAELNAEIIREIELSKVHIRKRKDGILELVAKPGWRVKKLSDMKEEHQAFLEIQEGEISPLFSDQGGMEAATPEANQYLYRHTQEFCNAVATMAPNPMIRFAGSVFVYIYRPPFPFKMFKTKQEALDWLITYCRVEQG